MKKVSFTALSILLSVFATPLFAQHLFLSAGSFTNKGSMFRGFENYVEISGVQYSVESASSYSAPSGPAAAKATFNEVVVTKNVDILSNELLRRISSGKTIPLIEILTTKTSESEETVVHKIELKDVYISNVSNAGVEGCTGNCGGLAESVKLVYKAIRITTYSIKPSTGAAVANENPFIFDVVNRTSTF
jgi:type VI secretion system Hcp family effector